MPTFKSSYRTSISILINIQTKIMISLSAVLSRDLISHLKMKEYPKLTGPQTKIRTESTETT